MSGKKKVLLFTPEYNFRLLGIVSDSPSTLLCYNLNKILQWNLERRNDYSLTLNETEVTFAYFAFEDEAMKRKIILLCNKAWSLIEDGENEKSNQQHFYLLPELKLIPFFLQCYGNWKKSEWNDLQKKIRKIEQINFLTDIDPQPLKSKEHLLNDL